LTSFDLLDCYDAIYLPQVVAALIMMKPFG